MLNRSRHIAFALLFALLACHLALAGCGQSEPPLSENVGTTSEIEFPVADPIMLSKDLADRIKPGMSVEEAMAILQDAVRSNPSARSMVDVAVTQAKLNNIRYDLTVTQGKRKIVLAFRDKKLTEKKQEGLE
jgi:hypothetical protein